MGEAGTPRRWWSRLCRCEGTWTREKSGDGLDPPVDHSMDSVRWVMGCGGGGGKEFLLWVTGWLGAELVPEKGRLREGRV